MRIVTAGNAFEVTIPQFIPSQHVAQSMITSYSVNGYLQYPLIIEVDRGQSHIK